jgi:hypothetical protein
MPVKNKAQERVIKKKMMTVQKQLMRCSAKSTLKYGQARTFIADFVINRYGRVQNIEVKTTKKVGNYLLTCVSKVLKKLRFPRLKQGGILEASQEFTLIKQKIYPD